MAAVVGTKSLDLELLMRVRGGEDAHLLGTFEVTVDVHAGATDGEPHLHLQLEADEVAGALRLAADTIEREGVQPVEGHIDPTTLIDPEPEGAA